MTGVQTCALPIFVGVCNETSDACEPQPANEGGTCDDGLFCTVNDVCTAGVCGGTARDCSASSDACNVGVCNETSDACEPQPANEGGACDDGLFCTVNDTCTAGVCGGTARDCSASSDTCNVGVCNETSDACEPQPANEGGSCDDGLFCTVNDTCAGGTCQGVGNPCDDGNPCTSDGCDEANDLCVYTSSGACDVTGTAYYYRDDTGSTPEPSSKEVPNVGIDDSGDSAADATTDYNGAYAFNDLAGNVTIQTLPKYGSPRASDHNDAVTSFDSVLIARHAVHLLALSDNQQIAGDASGNGVLTAYDAGLVAQFAVDLIHHLPVATATGSDWKFLRCSAGPPCTAPVYSYTPINGPQVADFYSILYGDVSGNWQKAGPLADTITTPEDEARAQDAGVAERLAAAGSRVLTIPPRTFPATLYVDDRALSAKGKAPRVISLEVSNADGVEGLDLSVDYDPLKLTITDVRSLDPAFNVVWNDQTGSLKLAFYGALPLQGSTRIVAITVAPKTGYRKNLIHLTAEANEGLVPVRVVSGPKPAGSHINQKWLDLQVPLKKKQ